jgi:excisionase family DNA binding protein
MKRSGPHAANANAPEEAAVAGSPSQEFLERQAFDAFKTLVRALRDLIQTDARVAHRELAEVAEPPASDVLTADEAAEFLGVDRNTVYDFAGRGVIPHQRLGKRLLFRRGTLVSWLDASLCKATSTRKG